MTRFWDGVEATLGVLWHLASTGLIHGTVLALITTVLGATLLRRARPALMAALWTIVLLKFLIPLGPEMPLSISGLVDAVLGAGAAPDAAPAVAHAAGAAPDAAARDLGAVLWLTTQVMIWVVYAGLVLWLLVRRVRVQHAQRRQAAALAPAGPSVMAIAVEAGTRLDLRRLPDVRVSDAAGPYVVGLWRPILVVPTWLAGAALRASLLHELAHLRRRDAWLRGVQLLASTLFWFWPVVRWVNRRIDAHREMACDQWAISCGPLGAHAYARMLLEVARRAASPMAEATMGLMGERAQIEHRVHALLAGGARPRLGLVTGTAVMIWALLSLGRTSGAQAGSAAAECVVAPGLVALIMTDYPDADIDGDGVLSREEVCAHQKRLQRVMEDEGGQAFHSALPDNRTSEQRQREARWLESLAEEGLPDCDACNCGEPWERDTSGALVSMERPLCPNQGEQ